MKKNILFFSGSLMIAMALVFSGVGGVGAIAHAETSSISNSTPVFYTQSGSPVYMIPGQAIPVGLYAMANGSPLYYYGDGVYYNATSQTYGDIYLPSFISTTYPGLVVVNTSATTPTAPNTGAGGESSLNWALLTLSALIVILNTTYLLRRPGVTITNKS